MLTLDLHGLRHWKVEEACHIFINDNWGKELRIITGNSQAMKTIVCDALIFYKLNFTLDNLYNMGYIVVKN